MIRINYFLKLPADKEGKVGLNRHKGERTQAMVVVMILPVCMGVEEGKRR